MAHFDCNIVQCAKWWAIMLTSKIPTFKNGNSGNFWANLWHLPRLWTCWNWAWIKTAKVSINWGQQRLDYIVPSYFEVKPGSSFSPRELWSLFDIWNHMTFSNSAQFKFGREIQLGFMGYFYFCFYNIVFRCTFVVVVV